MHENYTPMFYMDANTYPCLYPVSIHMDIKYHKHEKDHIYIV